MNRTARLLVGLLLAAAAPSFAEEAPRGEEPPRCGSEQSVAAMRAANEPRAGAARGEQPKPQGSRCRGEAEGEFYEAPTLTTDNGRVTLGNRTVGKDELQAALEQYEANERLLLRRVNTTAPHATLDALRRGLFAGRSLNLDHNPTGGDILAQWNGRRGAPRDREVLTDQQALVNLRFGSARDRRMRDGRLGAETTRQIIAFQRHYNANHDPFEGRLREDGVIDAATRERLRAQLAARRAGPSGPTGTPRESPVPLTESLASYRSQISDQIQCITGRAQAGRCWSHQQIFDGVMRHWTSARDRLASLATDAPAHLRTQLTNIANMDPRIVTEILFHESNFGDTRACSRPGACGIAQFMPQTGQRYGLSRQDRMDPEKSIFASLWHLGDMRQRYSQWGNRAYALMLAGYNAGEGRVSDRTGTFRRIRETVNYVYNISRRFNNRLMPGETPIDWESTMARGARWRWVGAPGEVNPNRAIARERPRRRRVGWTLADDRMA